MSQRKKIKIENNLEKIINIPVEILIITAAHSIYKDDDLVNKLLMHDPMLIFDTIGIFNPNQIAKLNNVHTVKVLGRGDI